MEKQNYAVKEQLKQVLSQEELVQMDHYSVKAVYEKLIGEAENVRWDNIVWNRLNVPKHRFIMWLIMQQKPQTTARLASSYEVFASDQCLICAANVEDHVHLFFRCEYSISCLISIKAWLNIQATTQDLKQLLRWVGSSGRSKFQKDLIQASLTALVYFIWQARNKVYWEACVPSIQMTCKHVKGVVRARILDVMPKNVSRRDQIWFSSLQ